MAKNQNLNSAAKNKNDEFYTQYDDIQNELNCYYLYDNDFLRGKTVLLPCDDPEWSNFTKFFTLNFEFYGLKRLISTSYAANRKKFVYKPANLFEPEQFNPDDDFYHGRIYDLRLEDLKAVDYPLKALNNWRYLQGDGDFRSDEVKNLRAQADVIITNPPFSLFREFLSWIGDKKFLIIANINCITYKEVFPLIKNDKIWLGRGIGRGISGFIVPEGYELYGTEARINKNGERIISTNQCLWLTNLELKKRHEPLRLISYADCEQFYPKVKKMGGFKRYDNYDVIEVPATDAIPNDFDGVMGVPITFLDKYCPEQFELLGCSYVYGDCGYHVPGTDWNCYLEGKRMFKRLFIRHRK